jgi:hypothetical protein
MRGEVVLASGLALVALAPSAARAGNDGLDGQVQRVSETTLVSRTKPRPVTT